MLNQSLSGIRVLDLTRLFPGPLCTLMLRDLGAEVIKIEPPEGELTRYIPPYQQGSSALFLQLNRGKRSLTVNLKKKSGTEIVRRLLTRTDVLVESFRPGVMRRFHLDYPSLKQDFASLIYCSISGFGQTGPESRKPGHDLNYISMAGILHLNGDSKRGYLIPPVQIADSLGAFQAVSAILAALFQRGRTGSGQHLDISLFDGAIFSMMAAAANHLAGVKLESSNLPLSGEMACYNVYRTKDNRYLALALLESKFWQTFCLKMKLDRLVNRQLVKDQKDLIEVLRNKFKMCTLQEWLDFFSTEDLCISPVEDLAAALSGRLVRQRELLLQVPYTSGTARHLKTPFVRKAGSTSRTPLLGQDNLEILNELGYDNTEILALKREGAI